MPSKAELWERFQAHTIAEPELRYIIGSHFGGAGQIEPGWVGYPDPAAPGIVLRYKGSDLVAIEAGPMLAARDIEAIEDRIAQAVTAVSVRIRRDFLFASAPTEGWWRYRDAFQLTPPPPGAPVPEEFVADHPLVLEYAVADSDDHGIRTVRETVSRTRIELLLGVLLTFRIRSPGHRMRKHWVYVHEERAEHGRTVWAQEMYSAPGFDAYPKAFTDTSAIPYMLELPDDEYYGHVGLSIDDRVAVPGSIDGALDRFWRLSSEKQTKFIRACYWFAHADAVWTTSASAAFISLVQAIEVLVPDVPQKECSTCGRQMGPGPRKRFMDFVETYAPEIDRSSRRTLYATRSALTHGGRLLHTDVEPVVLAGMHAELGEQFEQFGSVQRAARLGLVNWLHMADGV